MAEKNTDTSVITQTVCAGDRRIEVPTGLFVAGKWCRGSGGEDFEVIDASTSEAIVRVESATEQDAQRALDAAVAVQGEWAATSPRERAEILRRIFDLVQENAEELAAVQSLELGRALPDSRSECAYAAEFFRWFGEQAVRMSGEYRQAPAGAGRIVTHVKPVGPVLAVTPWNFPLAMIARKLAPALAAGCTLIAKPAQMTPLSTLYLARLAQQAGVPDGVFQVLPTHEARRVSSLLEDDRLRKLTFTGSTEVGQALAATAAQRTIRTSLELGGNAPLVVLSHADVATAVDAAVTAKMRGAGQVCIAANRAIVHRDVAEEFTAGVVERMREFVLGPGCHPDTTAGPLVSAEQRDGVAELVEDAVAAGARIRLGGFVPGAAGEEAASGAGAAGGAAADAGAGGASADAGAAGELRTATALDPRGFWYAPTVLTDVTPDNPISQQEIFGPVLPIQVVDSDAEAIERANDTPFGLAAYVVGERLADTMRAAEQLEAGMVGINKGAISDAAAPFGGVKQSGLGREGGFEGIEEYVDLQYLSLDL